MAERAQPERQPSPPNASRSGTRRRIAPGGVVVGGAAVGLGGLTAGRIGDDVVDLAVLGGEIAEGVEAFPVPELHRPAGGAGEEPPLHAHVDDAGGPVEHDAF
jgi:hypothetical protein